MASRPAPDTISFFVRMEGLEPTHLAAPDPKSGVSTNFTTSAIISILKANTLVRHPVPVLF